MIKAIPVPKPGDGIGQLWKTVAQTAHAINALRKLKVLPSKRNWWDISPNNATLEFVGGGDDTKTPVRLMGQPYAPPYLGGGDVPEDWGLNIKLRAVAVGTPKGIKSPSNPNQIFTLPPHCTMGYFIWLKATVDQDGNISALILEGGTEFPTLTTTTSDLDGELPPLTYFPLLVLTSDAHTVVLSETVYGATTALSLYPVVTALTFSVERRMQWSPATTINGNTSLI